MLSVLQLKSYSKKLKSPPKDDIPDLGLLDPTEVLRRREFVVLDVDCERGTRLFPTDIVLDFFDAELSALEEEMFFNFFPFETGSERLEDDETRTFEDDKARTFDDVIFFTELVSPL